ncbi:hypothetical protein CA13_39240 [Planctomycetes bacterium CA13]|uniref:Uncharacterized protein n=1 Tax=Novipirellula herctigrandis TaxID=2527986 RepID=A0A5C5Z6M3_9BACT|nr:hypothetical protein CA13_39240 [Planctomycetes bacterium CA13]
MTAIEGNQVVPIQNIQPFGWRQIDIGSPLTEPTDVLDSQERIVDGGMLVKTEVSIAIKTNERTRAVKDGLPRFTLAADA